MSGLNFFSYVGSSPSVFNDGIPIYEQNIMYMDNVSAGQVLATDNSNKMISIPYGITSVPNSVVQRDSNGNIPTNNSNLTANTVVVTNSSNIITSSSTTSTELGYVHGVTSAIQTQLNTLNSEVSTNTSNISTNTSNISTINGEITTINTSLAGKQASLSGLTSGDYIKATGSGSIGNASVLSESGSNLTAAGNFLPSNTNTNNLGNSNYTWGGVAANNIVAENGTVYNYCQSLTLGLINSNYGIYTTMTAGTANYYFCFGEGSGWFTNASILPSSDGYSALGASGQRWSSLYVDNIIGSGTILYNTANSSAGTGYPTMDSVFTYEYTVTALNVLNNTAFTFPYPSGKSASNIRKLEAVMYDGTSTVPQNYTVSTAYAFSLGCNGSGLYFQTAPSWSRTGLTITFYGWITTT